MARKTKVKKNQTSATSELLAALDIQPVNNSELVLLAKDKEEEELEKLVFGDLDGFKAGLRAHDEFESEGEGQDAGVHARQNAAKGKDLGALQDDEVGAFPELLLERWLMLSAAVLCRFRRG